MTRRQSEFNQGYVVPAGYLFMISWIGSGSHQTTPQAKSSLVLNSGTYVRGGFHTTVAELNSYGLQSLKYLQSGPVW